MSKVLALVAVAAFLVSLAVPVSADRGTELYFTCLDTTDSNQRAMQRAICDGAAQTAGFRRGILRRCREHPLAEFQHCPQCKLPGFRVYTCFAVGPEE